MKMAYMAIIVLHFDVFSYKRDGMLWERGMFFKTLL